MRDYSNYHSINNKEKLIHDGNAIFEYTLQNSTEACEVYIGEDKHTVIIQTKSSNSTGEDRIILCKPDLIKNGALINQDELFWMVTSRPINNNVYSKATIQLCNYTLKWQRDCRIITSPSIVFNRTSNRDDLSADRTMVLTTGQYHVYVQDNEDTRKLKIEDRFFLNNDVYKIAHIDDVTTIGLLTLTVNKDEFNSNIDNRELGISNYVDCPEVTPPIEDNTPVTPSTYEIIIEGTTTITQNQSKSYTAKIVENGIEISGVVTWAVDNANAQITSVDGNSCTVKGLKTGTSQLTAEWNGHATTFNVTIKSLW